MRRLFPLFALFLALTARAQMNPEWTTPLPPFQIADNLYYVGSPDLAVYLVTTPAGTILINAHPPRPHPPAALPDRRQPLLRRQPGPRRLPRHNTGREHPHQRKPRDVAA